MIKNHIKTAFRTLKQNKLYTFINISGLALSLTAAILLALWVWDELSFDRMHSKAGQIYAANGAIDKEMTRIWRTPAPLALFGKSEIPAIQNACRVNPWGGNWLFEHNDKKFNEVVAYADSTFFQLFDFKLLKGNRQQPFEDSRSILLSQKMAKKFFGEAEAMGQVLQANIRNRTENFTITGIMDDMPSNSSLKMDILLPFALLGEWQSDMDSHWGNFGYQTFFLIKPNADARKVGKQLTELQHKHNDSEFFKDLQYLMQPLTDIHLYNAKGEEEGMKQVKVFSLITVVIMLIACINYVNLTTARASRRSKEVGVRKVVGASKTDLFWQFVSESFVVFLTAMCIAIALVFALMPLYNSLSGKEMVFSLLDFRVWMVFALALFTTQVFAGVYPALLLSTFKPVLALKGIIPKLGQNTHFRKFLVVTQFACSVVLIVATLVISYQLTLVRNMDLGYSKENILTVDTYNFQKNYDVIRHELEQQPGIHAVTAASQSILDVGGTTGDIEWDGKPASMDNFMITQLSVEHNFIDVMGMELVAGQGFTRTPADSSHYILNETAVKQMGLSDPVGTTVSFHEQRGTIVAVVKDFHFKTMKSAIEPFILFMEPYWWNTLYIKTTGHEAQQAIAGVEQLWKQYNADYEFDYRFMDDAFDNMYKSDVRSGTLFNIFAGIAIVLSCLGLFGLVTYTAETKLKEIGIRKVLGASVMNITIMLSKDFVRLVLIAIVIASPIAWWMMNKWLEDFAYRIEIQWWMFAGAGLVAVVIALATVSGQAIRAALANPVDSLRDE